MTNASLKESRLRLGLTQKIIGKTEKGKKCVQTKINVKIMSPKEHKTRSLI